MNSDSIPVDDPAKAVLGNRKPTDVPAEELANMTPDQLKGTVNSAVEQGKKDQKDSSLKIKIELNLDVEIHLTARIKGDITIGLL